MTDNALTWMMNDPYCIVAMMNEFPCATIVDCHGNKHFSALTGYGENKVRPAPIMPGGDAQLHPLLNKKGRNILFY